MEMLGIFIRNLACTGKYRQVPVHKHVRFTKFTDLFS
uniref:Uncharacterized protein n=1 Tax=Anguilla anguilla TaxID=7936 RepID=A0A0E9PYL2_ANGAN